MRNQKIILVLVFVLMPLFLLNCFNNYQKISGSGNLSTKEHSLKNITSVQLGTQGKMYLKFGSEEKLVVEAEDNLHQYLVIKTTSDTLKIRSQKGYNLRPRKEIKYYVTLKNLDTLSTSSSGDIYAPGLKADKIKLVISSSGSIKVKDLEARKTYLKVSSSGELFTGKINSEQIEVSISSSGKIFTGEIKAGEIETVISSSGNFNTKGGMVNSQVIRISSSGSYKAEDLVSNKADIKISSSGSAEVYVKEFLKASISSSGDIYYRGNPEITKHYSSSGRLKKID